MTIIDPKDTERNTEESVKPLCEEKLASRRRKAGCGTQPPGLNSSQLLSHTYPLSFSFSFA